MEVTYNKIFTNAKILNDDLVFDDYVSILIIDFCEICEKRL